LCPCSLLMECHFRYFHFSSMISQVLTGGDCFFPPASLPRFFDLFLFCQCLDYNLFDKSTFSPAPPPRQSHPGARRAHLVAEFIETTFSLALTFSSMLHSLVIAPPHPLVAQTTDHCITLAFLSECLFAYFFPAPATRLRPAGPALLVSLSPLRPPLCE